MEVRVEDRNAAKVVLVKGDVDMGSSRKLREVLKDLTSKKTKRIVIHLKDMPYIDSSGLATLVECFRETQKYKGELRIAELTTARDDAGAVSEEFMKSLLGMARPWTS